MEKLEKILQTHDFQHHVYGLESHGLQVDDIVSKLDSDQFSYIFAQHYDSLKINDVREIKSLQSEKTENASVFVISFTHINNESQNALLKIIEEPRPNTIFFFIFPQAKNLLATVQSRMEIISLNRILDTKRRKIIVTDYLEMNLFEQFEYHKKLTDKKNKDDQIFLKSDMQAFLDDMEIYYVQKKPSIYRNEILEIIGQARASMLAKGLSLKMILDTIAIHMNSRLAE